MELVSTPKHIPTFIHVPKNAGTYVLSWFHLLHKVYCLRLQKNQEEHWSENNIRRFIVRLSNNKELTCCVYVNNNQIVTTEIDSHTNSIKLVDFLNSLNDKSLEVFSISVNPIGTGMKESFEAVDLICKSIHKDPCYFTILREPFSRAKSLFEYLNKENSKHEPSHNCFKLKNFHDYIASYYVEDSWIIRHILSLSQNSLIEPSDFILNKNHFLRCCEVLDGVRVYDMYDVDQAINEIISVCYGINQNDAKGHFGLHLNSYINFNHTNYDHNYKFTDLNASSQLSFLSRTYWDRKIYEHFVMRNKFPGFLVE